MRYQPEPSFRHDTQPAIGVLLANLGTPSAPTRKAVRKYLKEFLWDPRVVEIPRPLWWLILNAIILTVRPGKSARKYAAIWSAEGSPLMVHTARQATLLRGYLGERTRQPIRVAFGMRYGTPSISEALDELRAAGCTRILFAPLYPQYAASTTASAIDSVAQAMARIRNLPELRTIRSFHDHPGYIDAVARGIRDYWGRYGEPDALVLSFHGLPRFSLDRGDPYHCECHKTARLIGAALGIAPERVHIAFQSRFGRAEWLKPYTTDVLGSLAQAGVRRVDVACPGFVADCLETLEEIAIEASEHFKRAGGEALRAIPCLNSDDAWIRALMQIVIEHLGSWLEPAASAEDAKLQAAARLKRAQALGATR